MKRVKFIRFRVQTFDVIAPIIEQTENRREYNTEQNDVEVELNDKQN